MTELRLPALSVTLGSLISLIYVWSPGPYAMGAFTFIAQPLFIVGILSYGISVVRDLKKRGVL